MQELVKYIVIKIANSGLTQIIYYCFHVLAFVSVLMLAIWFGVRLNLRKKQSVLVVLIVYPLMYLWMLIQYWVENGFKNFGGQNIVAIFIWVPIIGLIAAKILKIKWQTICCLVAPLIVVNHAVGHLGCLVAGCCRGYPAESGLYICATGKYHFPIQPIESLIAFAIVICVVMMVKKQNYYPDERTYPTMLILFGSTRFICEFYRANEKILWGCSRLSFHALFMTLVGIVALIVIHNKNKPKKV